MIVRASGRLTLPDYSMGSLPDGSRAAYLAVSTLVHHITSLQPEPSSASADTHVQGASRHHSQATLCSMDKEPLCSTDPVLCCHAYIQLCARVPHEAMNADSVKDSGGRSHRAATMCGGYCNLRILYWQYAWGI